MTIVWLKKLEPSYCRRATPGLGIATEWLVTVSVRFVRGPKASQEMISSVHARMPAMALKDNDVPVVEDEDGVAPEEVVVDKIPPGSEAGVGRGITGPGNVVIVV